MHAGWRSLFAGLWYEFREGKTEKRNIGDITDLGWRCIHRQDVRCERLCITMRDTVRHNRISYFNSLVGVYTCCEKCLQFHSLVSANNCFFYSWSLNVLSCCLSHPSTIPALFLLMPDHRRKRISSNTMSCVYGR